MRCFSLFRLLGVAITWVAKGLRTGFLVSVIDVRD